MTRNILTLEEAKEINRRKYSLEWQCSDRDGGELRTSEEVDGNWGGYFTDWKDGLEKFNGSGHLSISSRGRYGQLEDVVLVIG